MGIPTPSDRVQVIKWESTSGGGTEFDEVPTGIDPSEDALEARGIYYAPASPAARDEEVWSGRDGDNLEFRDNVVTTPLPLKDILTEPKHEILDTLVHDLSENYYEEVIRASGKVSSVVVWTDISKTKKIRECLLTRNTIGQVKQIVTNQYNALGVLKHTLTENITRVCGRASTITATAT